MHDIGRFDAMQNHIHHADDIGQRLFFLAVKGFLLQGLRIAGGQVLAVFQIFKRLAQKASRTDRAVINLVADGGSDHFHDGLDQRTRRVVFAAVSSRVAHVLDFVFVQMRHLMLFGMGTKAEFIDAIDDFPQVIAALNLVFQLAENLADLIFDGVGASASFLNFFR